MTNPVNNPISNEVYSVATAYASTSAFINVVAARNPTPSDYQYPVQKRWINSATGLEYYLLNFTSTGGVVQANWLLLSAGTGVLLTLTGNFGPPVSPIAGNIFVQGDNSTITITGTFATATLIASVILPVNHSVLISNTSSIAGAGPNAASGIPLISQGVSADPIFGTVTVPGGGTGVTSFTPFVPITGGATSTGPLLQATTGFGTVGNVLTSTGSGSLPTWQAPSGGGQITWQDASGAFSALARNGYFITAIATATLPASPTLGDTIEFITAAAGILTIKAPGTQFIAIAQSTSSAGGTAVNTLQGDCITLVYRNTNTTWMGIGYGGSWILA